MPDISVLVVDAHSDFAVSVVRCLGSCAGVTVHVLSRRPQAPAAASRYVASAHVCEDADDAQYLEHIVATAERVGAVLCLAVDDEAIGLLAQSSSSLAGRIRLAAVPSPASLAIARDKWWLATFLDAHGLPHPPTRLGTDAAALDVWGGRSTNASVLLKPRAGGNGAGIRRFGDARALAAHLSADADAAARCVVQQEIIGSDIDCSVLCAHGEIVAYTIQRSFLPVSGGFMPAGGIDFVDDDRVLSTVRDLMKALDWHGVAHVDLRYDVERAQLYVIEINPRFWGSLLGSLRAGVNFPVLACRVALGESVDTPRRRPCRFVAGGTAMQAWCHGTFRRRHAGFGFSDTAFADIQRDLKPSIVECCEAVSRVARSVGNGLVARGLQMAASAAAVLLTQELSR